MQSSVMSFSEGISMWTSCVRQDNLSELELHIVPVDMSVLEQVERSEKHLLQANRGCPDCLGSLHSAFLYFLASLQYNTKSTWDSQTFFTYWIQKPCIKERVEENSPCCSLELKANWDYQKILFCGSASSEKIPKAFKQVHIRISIQSPSHFLFWFNCVSCEFFTLWEISFLAISVEVCEMGCRYDVTGKRTHNVMENTMLQHNRKDSQKYTVVILHPFV